MLKNIHANKGLQLVLGLLLGLCFGFLLQKGGVTTYDVIIGQLLLYDFTVVKIMLTAVLTGMIGVHALRGMGLAALHPKPGAAGSTVAVIRPQAWTFSSLPFSTTDTDFSSPAKRSIASAPPAGR